MAPINTPRQNTPWRQLLHGADPRPRLMAILNASPESFYAGSVASGHQAVRDAAERMAAQGADIIDVGAMSTAPYKQTRISAEQEAERLVEAITAVREVTNLPISADTSRTSVALAALDAGADAINDVTGLSGDATLAPLLAARQSGVILMANEMQLPKPSDQEQPVEATLQCLRQCLSIAHEAGINADDICLDPGIGFFRSRNTPWHQWDVALLNNLRQFEELGYPLAISASRKSFIGHLLGLPNPEDRLAGSLIAATHAARLGARIIRTHDIAATRDALAMMAHLNG